MSIHTRRRRGLVLRNWVNAVLADRGVHIETVDEMKTGVAFIRLAELTTGLSMKEEIYTNPANRTECVQNVHSLTMFTIGAGMPITNMASIEDVVDSHVDKVLPLMWFFVRRYYLMTVKQMKASTETMVRSYVLRATQALLKDAGITVEDCGQAWADGFLLLHLVGAYDPQLVDVERIDRKAARNAERALQLAERQLGVPAIITAADLRAGDDVCNMTYLVMFLHMARDEKARAREKIEALERSVLDREAKQQFLISELAKNEEVVREMVTENKEMHKFVTEAVNERDHWHDVVTRLSAHNVQLKRAAQRNEARAENARAELSSAAEEADASVVRSQNEKRLVEAQLQENLAKRSRVSKELTGLLQAAQFAAADKDAFLKQSRSTVLPPTGWVTLMFTDVENSTKQWEDDADEMYIAVTLHNNIIRGVLDKYAGYEVRTEGDAFLVAFDDSARAVACAMAIQEALLACTEWPSRLMNSVKPWSPVENKRDGTLLYRGLRVRIGLHSGIPQCVPDVMSGRMDYIGPMVIRAGRVETGAWGGQTVCSDTVWNEIKDRLVDCGSPHTQELGFFQLRDLSSEVLLYQLMPPRLASRKPHLAATEVNKMHDQVDILKNRNRMLLEQMRIMEESTKRSDTALISREMAGIQRQLGARTPQDAFIILETMLDKGSEAKYLESLRRKNAQLQRDIYEMREYDRVQRTNLGRLQGRAEGPVTARGGPEAFDKEKTAQEWQAKIAELQAAQDALLQDRASLTADLLAQQKARQAMRQKTPQLRKSVSLASFGSGSPSRTSESPRQDPRTPSVRNKSSPVLAERPPPLRRRAESLNTIIMEESTSPQPVSPPPTAALNATPRNRNKNLPPLAPTSGSSGSPSPVKAVSTPFLTSAGSMATPGPMSPTKASSTPSVMKPFNFIATTTMITPATPTDGIFPGLRRPAPAAPVDDNVPELMLMEATRTDGAHIPAHAILSPPAESPAHTPSHTPLKGSTSRSHSDEETDGGGTGQGLRELQLDSGLPRELSFSGTLDEITPTEDSAMKAGRDLVDLAVSTWVTRHPAGHTVRDLDELRVSLSAAVQSLSELFTRRFFIVGVRSAAHAVNVYRNEFSYEEIDFLAQHVKESGRRKLRESSSESLELETTRTTSGFSSVAPSASTSARPSGRESPRGLNVSSSPTRSGLRTNDRSDRSDRSDRAERSGQAAAVAAELDRATSVAVTPLGKQVEALHAWGSVTSLRGVKDGALPTITLR